MKVLLVAGSGERERASAAHLSRSLGADARVLAAARGDGETRIERTDDGWRILRADPAPEHWQRTRSGAVAALLRTLLDEHAPDVVDVLGTRGLVHDLVAIATQAGARAVLSLGDPGYACLVGDRVRADVAVTGVACDAPLGPSPCLGCAEARFGRTPWVPIEARFLAVAERRRDALRELALARRVLVATAADAEAARRALGDPLERVAFAVIDPRDAAGRAGLLARVAAEPAPARVDTTVDKGGDWWSARMQAEAERAWDESWLSALVQR